jgi:hypothetical protein
MIAARQIKIEQSVLPKTEHLGAVEASLSAP